MLILTKAQAQRLGIISSPPKQSSPSKTYLSAAQWWACLVEGGVKFVIPESLPSLNEWKDWHWSKQRKYKRLLPEAIIHLSVLVGKPRYERARVEVIHYYSVKRRRDFDNAVPKFILDALKNAGVIFDDNSDVLELPEPKFLIDRDFFRTEVFVYQKD